MQGKPLWFPTARNNINALSAYTFFLTPFIKEFILNYIKVLLSKLMKTELILNGVE